MRNIKNPRKRTRRWLRGILLSIALFVLAALIDAVLYEPTHPVLTTYHIAIPNLPRELNGYKIVQMSDFHRHRRSPDLAIIRAVELANTTHADAAVLTGDFVGKRTRDIEPCFKMLDKLRVKHGSYAVLGNHDHWTGAKDIIRAIDKHHITLLNNTNSEAAKGLYLVGIDDQWTGKPDVKKAFEGVGKNSYVMLSHTPKAVGLFKDHKSLLITGHTHGGQGNLPFIQRNKLPGLKGWKYIGGWYREYGILMYVNRGVGTIAMPIRFRCRPEVTLYVLHPTSQPQAQVFKEPISHY